MSIMFVYQLCDGCIIIVRASFRGRNGKYNTKLCGFLVVDASRNILKGKIAACL